MEGIFPLFQGRDDRFRHALPNLGIGVLNGLIISLLFSTVTLKVMHFAESRSWGLLHQLSLSSWIEGAFAFVLFDLWMYVWHVANHQIPFLWRFHRMHHSDLELDATSALRFHTGEIVFSSLLRLIVIPLIGMQFIQLLIYELCLQPIIIFHHSNVALPEKIDRIFRAIIVTPNMHRVHHSQIRSETDSNYSSIFSFWDRIVKSFHKRKDTRTLVYGLPYLQEKEWQSLLGMIKTPFVNIPYKRR
ncbi:MAG: sterol desaturase family protein [Candidatus Omnitrophica bacterium]|nr:sterol desaturase family protein [Candidatus Omnitrophota bacterium]